MTGAGGCQEGEVIRPPSNLEPIQCQTLTKTAANKQNQAITDRKSDAVARFCPLSCSAIHNLFRRPKIQGNIKKLTIESSCQIGVNCRWNQ
jgi:hypothetical protein